GKYASLCPTGDYYGGFNEKGWHIGGNVTIFKNVIGYIGYSDSKTIDTDMKMNTIWRRVRFIF
ncbi:MAG: S-layer protein, partial [Schwartzia sp.]|nr:S-layer protein [Schwartzia sp. (in: firmicutes)]